MEKINDASIVQVSHNEWTEAQKYEKNTWEINNRPIKNGYLKVVYKFIKSIKNPKRFWKLIKYQDFYCGDDWNYWWLEQFEEYGLLPKKCNRSLEVGSGPYSNSRLISRIVKISEIYCLDPLMETYRSFKKTWISQMARKNKIITISGQAEELNHENSFFDLVICINVLDHVENAEKCFSEMFRVLRPGGFFVFGQELSDEKDLSDEHVLNEPGHPIKLQQKYLDYVIDSSCNLRFKKILERAEGRDASHRGGTYLFIGTKKLS